MVLAAESDYRNNQEYNIHFDINSADIQESTNQILTG